MFKSDSVVELISYNDESEALTDVKSGDTWGYLTIPDNFTSSLISKFTGGVMTHGADVVLDMSNHQVSVVNLVK